MLDKHRHVATHIKTDVRTHPSSKMGLPLKWDRKHIRRLVSKQLHSPRACTSHLGRWLLLEQHEVKRVFSCVFLRGALQH